MKSSPWQCQACGRRFGRQTKEHSCDITSIDDHLRRASPAVKETFHALREMLDRIGPHRLVPLKTMMTISTTGNIGGVTVRRARLDVGFMLARLLKHPRVVKVERLSPRKFAYHVDLTSPADVDEELESWFREAFATSFRSAPA